MLTETERTIVAIVRGDPLVSTLELAERLDTTREAVRVHLSNLGKKGVILGRGFVLREERAAVVIGGANVDIKARSSGAAVPATSNPGSASSSVGGVGRNIAENLARLGTPTHLLSVVGTDAFGDRLLRDTAAAGVLVDHVVRTDTPTGTYVAVLDDDGELVTAVSDMAASDEIDRRFVEAARPLLGHAGLVVLDGNLGSDAIGAALDIAAAAGVEVIVDPVSDAKAARLADAVDPARPIFAITPNRSELAALTGSPTRTSRQLAAAAADLHDRGVEQVWVSLGRRGSVLFRSGRPPVRTDPAPLAAPIADVTGAGDAMVAALAHAHLDGRPMEDAVAFAHAAAALTIEHAETVRPDLSSAVVEARVDPDRTIRRPTTTRQTTT
ncbi:MAG: PfkB family carbohydrate kinase [Actinomycetota bacterium]